MELKSITIEKFKKISKAKFALAGLNILVGANGSGKSSALQAIHLSSCLMRQANTLRADKTATVNTNELDYLPSNHYAELGHNNSWGNMEGSSSTKVEFDFIAVDATPIKAWCEIRSARNAGISVKGVAPSGVSTLFRGVGNFFSAYIPGISGIPNHEQKQSKRVVLKACSFGDSNVYLRNALNLLKPNELKKIELWLTPLIGGISLNVSHNNDRDLVINARAKLGSKEFPLELLGTGYLQLIQIFCYILLFKPKILLIDEPDIHLHPNVQEKLSSTLFKIAQEIGIKIFLSTHSPFIVRGAPLGTNIFWMENGKIAESNRDTVEIAMGWGAFGKKLIIVSEDQKPDLLKKIVSQWPDLEKYVSFYPGKGYASLLKKDEAEELYNTLGQKYHILVHRDRDSLTNEEVQRLVDEYEANGISLWITDQSDVEAYFCAPGVVAQVANCEQNEASQYIDQILTAQSVPIKEQFSSQREAHNQELYKTGGSPANDDVWNTFQGNPLRGAKGKFVFKQLKNKIPSGKFSESSVQNLLLAEEVALSLKEKISEIISDDE